MKHKTSVFVVVALCLAGGLGGAVWLAFRKPVSFTDTGSQMPPMVGDPVGATVNHHESSQRTSIQSTTEKSKLWQALRAAESIRDQQERDQQLSDLFQQLVAQNPREAAAFLQSLPDSHPRVEGWILELSSSWFESDPTAALDWIKKLSNEGRQLSALQRVTPMASASTAPSVAEALMGIKSGEELARMATILANIWSSDPAAATHWLLSLNDSHSRLEGLKSIMSSWGEKAPVQAASELLQMPEALRSHPDVIGPLLEAWMRKDADGAVEWINALPAGDTRTVALAQISFSLSDDELPQLWNYASRLPPSTPKDRLMSSLLVRQSSTDPAHAASQAMALADVDIRHTTLSQVMSGWTRASPLDAAAFIADLQDETLQTQMLHSVLYNWPESQRAALHDWVNRFPPELQASIRHIIFPPPADPQVPVGKP